MDALSRNLRILIVRLGAMGDILHALPAVTALRREMPQAHIGWVVEPRWAPLLRAEPTAGVNSEASDSALLYAADRRGPAMPLVDVVHFAPVKQWARAPLSPRTFWQLWRLRTRLRAERYQVAIDLQGAVRSAMIARMAAAKQVIGEAEPRESLARYLFGNRVATSGVHVIEQATDVVSALIGSQLPNVPAALPRDAAAECWLADLLRRLNLHRFVVMNPGAGWGAKRWPADRYGALADELNDHGWRTLVNAAPEEAALASDVCAASNGAARSVVCSVTQMIALMRSASLFVGGDTGPMHLAAALQRPVVGIFGPTDPARNGPYGTPARVLRHPESKRDHTRRAEPEAGLLTITVEAVASAALELLEISE